MRTRPLPTGLLIAAAILGGAWWGITGEPLPKLQAIGRFAASTSLVPGGTTIRIRIAETAEFYNCRIVVAELAEGRVKAHVPGTGSSILREWTLREATSQPVLVYQMTNASYVGIGLMGAVIEPREEPRGEGDFQTFAFPAFSGRMVLDVKLVEPEF